MVKQRGRSEIAYIKHQEMMLERKARDAELMAYYGNKHCRICGSIYMAGSICRRAGGTVCMKHCMSCEFYRPILQHCIYKG